jgi:methanethiol S-methyltransferase
MVWLISSIFLWGLLHSFLASLNVKKLVLRWFGDNLSRFYRLAYNIFASVSLLPIIVIAFLMPDRRLYLVHLPWSALMVMGEFLAVLMLAAAFRQTGALEFLGLQQLMNTSSSVEQNSSERTKQGHLVTSGLYRYVRHPLYLAGLVFIWLLPVMTVNILAINLSFTVYIIIGALIEERKLGREFGREYSDYTDVTPMFIPFLNGNKK